MWSARACVCLCLCACVSAWCKYAISINRFIAAISNKCTIETHNYITTKGGRPHIHNRTHTCNLKTLCKQQFSPTHSRRTVQFVYTKNAFDKSRLTWCAAPVSCWSVVHVVRISMVSASLVHHDVRRNVIKRHKIRKQRWNKQNSLSHFQAHCTNTHTKCPELRFIEIVLEFFFSSFLIDLLDCDWFSFFFIFRLVYLFATNLISVECASTSFSRHTKYSRAHLHSMTLVMVLCLQRVCVHTPIYYFVITPEW